MKQFFITLRSIVLFVCAVLSSCSVPVGSRKIVIATYNVHNLFDDVDDGTEYPDYDPGTGRWGTQQYRRKLSSIAEVIQMIGPGGPDVLALQEIESEKALRTLTDEYLRTSGYICTYIADGDQSAVHVALLSRYPVIAMRNHRLDTADYVQHRLIQEAVIDIDGARLFVFNNHWKSKSGGAQETESARRSASRLVRHRIRSILSDDPNADVVVLGDLNESHDELDRVQGAYPTALVPIHNGDAASRHDGLLLTFDPEQWSDPTSTLYSAWPDAEHPGSYVYQGVWQTIDHILVSQGLLDEFSLSMKTFGVVDNHRLLDGNGYPNTYSYSDHLPLVAELSICRELAIPRVVEGKDPDG